MADEIDKGDFVLVVIGSHGEAARSYSKKIQELFKWMF
jgi:hypothetical protein